MREKQLINEKIEQREHLYAKRLAETQSIKSKDEEIYDKQIKELEAKEQKE